MNAVVAQEYIDDEPQGTFVVTDSGQVVYRHNVVGEIFANISLTDFIDCTHAWERYRAGVKGVVGEEAQMRIVKQLEHSLSTVGGLRENGFWMLILEQAESGQL